LRDNCNKPIGQVPCEHGATKTLFVFEQKGSYIGRNRGAQPMAGPSVPKSDIPNKEYIIFILSVCLFHVDVYNKHL